MITGIATRTRDDERPLVGVYPQGRAPEWVYVDGRRSDRNDLDDALGQAAALGAEVVVEPLAWGVVEPEPGRFDWTQQEWWEQAVSRLPRPVERVYSVWATHMWRRGRLPAGLETEAFDSPRMTAAFERFVAAAAERCRWDRGSPLIVISNEIDVFTDNRPEERDALVRFLHRAAEVVRAHAPRARVSNTVTHTILDKPGGPELGRRLMESCDIVGFNWYDITSTFPTRLAPRTPVTAVLDRMAALAEGRPLFLQETGLPSSPIVGSSLETQAAIVDELFDAAANLRRDQLWAFLWFELHDYPTWLMLEWLREDFPVLVGETEFVAFLSSLGLRTARGEPKPAFDRFRTRLAEHLGRPLTAAEPLI